MTLGAPRATLALLALVLAACSVQPSSGATPGSCPASAPTAADASALLANARRAVVVTSLGTFSIDLSQASAPFATANFIALAGCGFYDGLTFHRVLAGFVAQAGDPQTRERRGPFQGLGQGGPGYHFGVELPSAGVRYDRYFVALANAVQFDPVSGAVTAGLDTNGSQFFIALDDLAGRLRPVYSVIGRVTVGTEVVDAIGSAPVDNPTDGVPLTPVVILSVRVEGGS